MDHVDLFRAFRSADVAGAKLMLSNSDTPRTRELYAGFNITEVQVGRSVNSNTAKRGRVTELVIRNYS
jgi:DNA adenine methylase